MRRTPDQLNALAAGFVATALGSVHPADRRDLLAALVGNSMRAATTMIGAEGCSEMLYGIADHVATSSDPR